MGWGDWSISKAWNNATSAVSNAASSAASAVADAAIAVKDTAVEATTQVAARVAVSVGGSEAEWATNRVKMQNAVASAAIESVADTVESSVEVVSNAAVATGGFIGEAAMQVAAAPVSLVSDAEWAEKRASAQWEGVKGAGNAVAGFAEYAWDNPARASALVTQGVVNGVTSAGGAVVGLATDAVRLGYQGTVGNVIALGTEALEGIHNLGLDETGHADFKAPLQAYDWDKIRDPENGGVGSFFGEVFQSTVGVPEWLNKHTQIKDGVEWLHENTALDDAQNWMSEKTNGFVPDAEGVLDAWQGPKRDIWGHTYLMDENGDAILDENGEKQHLFEDDAKTIPLMGDIPNPDYGYERTLLYGGQAAFEIPAFVVSITATGGVAGFAWAGRGAKVVGTVARVGGKADDVARVVASGATKVDDAARVIAGVSDDVAKVATNTADDVAKVAAANVDDAVRIGAGASDDVAKVAAANADEVGDGLAKGFRSAESVRRTQLADDAIEFQTKANKLRDKIAKLDDVADANKIASLEAKAAKLESKAEGILAGQRGSSIISGRTSLAGKRVAAQQDLLETLAKPAAKFRDKFDELEKLKAAGITSGSKFDKAQKAVDAAEEVLMNKLKNANQLASRVDGLEQISDEAAKAARYLVQDMKLGERLATGFNTGSQRGFRHVGDFTQGGVRSFNFGAEMTGASLAFGLGYHSDNKRQEAEAEQRAGTSSTMAVQGVTDTIDEGSSKVDAYLKSLGSQYQESAAPSDGVNTDTFNNRSNGTVTPLDKPITVDSSDISPQRQLDIQRTLGGN